MRDQNAYRRSGEDGGAYHGTSPRHCGRRQSHPLEMTQQGSMVTESSLGVCWRAGFPDPLGEPHNSPLDERRNPDFIRTSL